MDAQLAAGYEACRRVCLRSQSNFLYAFRLLQVEQRRAMHALYSYYRLADDAVDLEGTPAEKRRALLELRQNLLAANAGKPASSMWRAIAHMQATAGIPLAELLATLDGMESDLQGFVPEDGPALDNYCLQVAGVVGRACVRIWGFRQSGALQLAEQVGRAFQLTNILRDIKEDQERGRCYVPRTLLQAAELTPEGWLAAVADKHPTTEALLPVLQPLIAQARVDYTAGWALEPELLPAGRPIFRTLLRTYLAIFEQIETQPERVFTERIRLSPWRKTWLGLCAWQPLHKAAC